MKILAVALAEEEQRFVKGYPPKGAWLFLTPNLEISRLAALCTEDEFIYLDERIAEIKPGGEFDLAVILVNFGQGISARLVAEKLAQINPQVVLFGPQVTAWGTNLPEWVSHAVIGDITNVWDEIRADSAKRSLKPLYKSPPQPRYIPLKTGLGNPYLMNTKYQAMQFIRGCACPFQFRHLCPQYLYYGNSMLHRKKEEILGELLSLPGKHIQLLDEDIARFPDYYYEIFSLLWNYPRYWTVQAGEEIFNHPRLIWLLAKAGTKIIFLNDTFLTPYLKPALEDAKVVKWLYRRVKSLQTQRMLVGAKLNLSIFNQDFALIADILCRIDLDLLEIRFTQPGPDGRETIVPLTYRPNLQPDSPLWIKSRFYAIDTLLDRFIRRPRRVGFHSTIWFLIPYSLAYRQNFLEGVAYP
ncbi:MAG: hypothetical protein ABIK39_03640 [candidate division WOR-3 bacterium]